MKRSFLKRSLLLSAASAAALSVPALADNLDVTTNLTSPVKTSTASNNTPGNITIESNGSITITQSGPAVTLDSSNTVSLFGSLSNKNTSNAQGILIDTGNGTTPSTLTGSLIVLPGGSLTTIDLSGSGSGKLGIGLTGNGTFTGNINFNSGTIAIQGDSSTGIGINTTGASTLNGDFTFGGSIQMTPTTANETNVTGITGISLAGTITGDVTLSAGSSLQIFGNGSRGVVSTATINGSFANFGLIGTEGFQTSQNQSTGAITSPKGAGDPLGGSAVQIGKSILGGFFNAGPDGTTSGAATANISMDGGGLSSPVVYVTPALQGVASPTAIQIGVYAGDTVNPGYAFYNRGAIGLINGTTLDPNLSVAGVLFAGTSATADVELGGKGFFNSGTIAVAGRTTSAGSSPITVVALGFGSVAVNDTSSATGGFVKVGDGSAGSGLFNSGSITAQAQGDLGATVIAIDIGKSSVMKSLTNSGTILASAATNNPSTVQTEIMYAINDQSGTLSAITNSGSITAATSTPLTVGSTTTIAANLGANTTGVNFTNTGLVTGDVIFGEGADTLSVTGTSTKTSSVFGNINFGSNFGTPGSTDKLEIGAFGVVSGQIQETDLGMLDVHIASGGTLNVLNNSVRKSLLLNDLTLDNNAHLNIAVSTQLPGNVSISADDITVTSANASTIGVVFSSFIPATGRFVLMQAPTGHLDINGGDPSQVIAGINGNIPFLFTGTASFLADQAGLDQLVLDLTPKSASALGLSGYAAQVFPYVNTALENDDSLGAAMIAGITNNAQAQTAYSQFAPDASGGTRAIAISLTDHATGPVAARQRTLRLYATQPGDLTLWGQEFAQQISDKGSDGLPGFKDSGFGFALGADGGDARSGWFGGAFTFYTGNVDQRAPQSSRDNTQWYMLSGYSTWRGKGLFLDTQLTAGYGDLSAHRFITIGGISRQANSKRSAVLGAAGMTTGANFVYGSTTLTPNLALDGLTMREEGYTETGGNGTTGDAFDLHVNPVVMSSLRAFVGLNARQDVNFGSFYMQPELRAGYRYDFLADRIDLTAHFPGVSSTATGPGTGDFTITGPHPSKGNLLAGASISATTGAWSIGINYDMLSGSNGSMTQVGTLSLVGRI
ncbi:MAG TPA: autotransporter outer membrane beta-barrel domain-containing protein [Rhizomicrobium sp.]|nr:autotransporter outer membrane beta-barrel domain-containing protein [Rhizomicrobium sp.]